MPYALACIYIYIDNEDKNTVIIIVIVAWFIGGIKAFMWHMAVQSRGLSWAVQQVDKVRVFELCLGREERTSLNFLMILTKITTITP